MLVEVSAVGLLSAGATLVSAPCDGVTGSATRAASTWSAAIAAAAAARSALFLSALGIIGVGVNNARSTCNRYRCCLSRQALEIHGNPYDLDG